MLKLKLQYFGHWMLKTDSFEKTLMLGKIEGGRRRGRQRMRWLDGITYSMDKKKESEVAQSCPTLCDHMDCSPPGSSVHGILQARILEWVAISSPGDLPDPGIEPRSPALQADTLTSEPPGRLRW